MDKRLKELGFENLQDAEAYLEELREQDKHFHELYGECQYDICSQIHNGEALLAEIRGE